MIFHCSLFQFFSYILFSISLIFPNMVWSFISKSEATVAASLLSKLNFRRSTIVTQSSNTGKWAVDVARIFGSYGVAINFRPSTGFYDEITDMSKVFPTDNINIISRSSIFPSVFDAREGPIRLRFLTDKYRWLIRNHYSWIVFMDHAEENLNYVIHIPYCVEVFLIQPSSMGFNIWEQYNANYTIKRTLFGLWTPSTGTAIKKSSSLFQRRNLSGTIIKTYVIDDANGTFGDMMMAFKDILDCFKTMFNLRYVSMNWTSIDETNDYEIIPSPYLYHYVTPFREKTIGPVLKINMYLYFQHLNTNPLTNYILRPFDTELWCAIIIWMLLAMITSTIVRASTKEGIPSLIQKIFSVFDAFCCQDSDEDIDKASERMVSLSTWILVFIVVSAYSSVIFSFMVVRKIYLPFTNVQEMIENGKYRYTGMNSKLANNLQHVVGPKTSIAEAARRFLIDEKLAPATIDETLQRICNDKHFAYLGYGYTILKSQSPCKLQRMPTPFLTLSMTLKTQHGFSLASALKEKLPILFSNGVMSRLQKMTEQELLENEIEGFLPTDAELTLTVLLIVPISVVISLVLLVFEFLNSHRKTLQKILVQAIAKHFFTN